ncbi:MAG TPA: TonB-dependent receptor [Thermoanaerobaculia bacterium]|jgi:outer membrane receptor for ferrienterochelin and colicin|nr:TonB-dependent receptor [Thermoanaerobaculia bacterium]
MKRVLALSLVLIAATLSAQTTGGLIGKVTDSTGAAVPGVTVEARSPALQGTRTTVTETDGGYRFALLPPGQYSVAFNLSGFATETRNRVVVALGKDSTLDVTLRPAAVSEQLTVSAEAPVLDTTSASLGTNLSTRAIETLPTGRNYSSIVQVVPGVSTDASNNNTSQSTITVYGSSGAENAYYIDGVNTTNLEYGFQGKELNFEFISEVDVKTGGYEAEYGRSTGGIINVITKSGGNAFTGDVFGYYDNDSLQSNAKSVVSTAGVQQGFTRKDYGVDVGGFIMRDKLWFFGAFDAVRNSVDNSLPGGPRAGDIVTSNSHRNLGSGKLTYNLAPNHSLVGTFLQDPRVDTGAINDRQHTLNGDPSTYLGRQDFGGRDYALRYDGSFRSKWIASAQVARHREKNSVGPATSAGEAVEYLDVGNDSFQTGGFGLIQNKTFDRKHYSSALTRILAGHEIKGGLEYEQDKAKVTKRMSGGQQVSIFANDVDPKKPIYLHFYWTTPDATLANAPLSALLASPEHRVTTAYLQDRWSVNNRIVVTYGVRWDRQEIIDSSGVKQIDMKKDFAPRLGFIWDPTGVHRMKIYGSYGQFYEEIPMDLVIRSYSYERQPNIINYSPTSITPDPKAEADFDSPSKILGGFTEPSDPDIKNQYMNEFIVGAEREVMPNVAVGVKGIYRNYGRVVEDYLCIDDGTYCIGNPSEGDMKRIFTLDYSQTFPAPKPKRTFKGVQLDATKRFSNNWQGIASYLYSKLDGNFDGEFAPFTNVGADPNISAAYDYYDFFTNGKDLTKITNTGPLSNDRRHQFKVSGVYETPYRLSVGLSAYWRSGTPFTRYGYSDAYGRYEFFLTKRGGEGRMPSNYDADLHLGYPILVSNVKVNLLFDVFNVFNTQRPILLDERWGFQESDNDSATPVNPGYGQPVLRTPPTSARVGVRVTF